jgi:hypothetical protein
MLTLEPSHLDPGVRAAIVESLTHLREVFFVSKPRTGRQVLNLVAIQMGCGTLLNRSFPIMAQTPTFERLYRDPCPIAEDLK